MNGNKDGGITIYTKRGVELSGEESWVPIKDALKLKNFAYECGKRDGANEARHEKERKRGCGAQTSYEYHCGDVVKCVMCAQAEEKLDG